MSDLSSIGLSPEYFKIGTSSFYEFASAVAPQVLPAGRAAELGPGDAGALAPHGTTIAAATFPGGVVVAGDRRATAGNVIAQRDIEKVYPADEFSVISIAGSAGIGLDMMRLFQLELEHYEKLEGSPLSLVGKANRLATMVRGNLALALQGLIAVPLFAGWDLAEARGRIFSYDPTGGRYEEHDFYSIGSGSLFARGSLKKLYRPDLDAAGTTMAVIQALYDAADDDSATGGPDVTRRIYPVILIAGPSGVERVTEDRVAELVDQMLTGRMQRPDGPGAPLS
ncbi:proteasome subunit beta [Microlunatus speluncae]|uniref:proteasome subunit beta n=1 Tax=Microlunatus speluncae TaxID=2594267 RepID=UPI0012663C43|nr:proteasome subunit beta [Microlunatus speluncae]